MWNTPPDGPFRFDGGAPKQLWTRIPLRDEAVINKLEHLRKLTPPEQTAVQNLYYMPRVDLAPFACLFPSLDAAERHLIEERSEQERWAWFRRHFALAYKRCHIIASHLVGHVAAATESGWEGGHKAAWLILQRLFAENRAKTTWEAPFRRHAGCHVEAAAERRQLRRAPRSHRHGAARRIPPRQRRRLLAGDAGADERVRPRAQPAAEASEAEGYDKYTVKV